MRPFVVVGMMATAMALPGAPPAGPNRRFVARVEGRVWVERIREALAGKAWTVDLHGNEIHIRRQEPICFDLIIINGPMESIPETAPRTLPRLDRSMTFPDPAAQEAPVLDPPSASPRTPEVLAAQVPPTRPLLRECLTYILRFGPPMGMGEYRRRTQWNEDLERKRYALELEILRQPGITTKFTDHSAFTPEGEAKLAEYRKAMGLLSKELKVPALFTPAASVTLFESAHPNRVIADLEVRKECESVKGMIIRLFGVYDSKGPFSRFPPS